MVESKKDDLVRTGSLTYVLIIIMVTKNLKDD